MSIEKIWTHSFIYFPTLPFYAPRCRGWSLTRGRVNPAHLMPSSMTSVQTGKNILPQNKKVFQTCNNMNISAWFIYKNDQTCLQWQNYSHLFPSSNSPKSKHIPHSARNTAASILTFFFLQLLTVKPFPLALTLGFFLLLCNDFQTSASACCQGAPASSSWTPFHSLTSGNGVAPLSVPDAD